MSADVVFRADMSQFDSDVDQSANNAKRSQAAIISGFRQAAGAGVLVAEITGSAMGQIMTSYIEVVFTGIEVIQKAAAATSLATFGISGVFMIAQLIAMGFLITQLHQKKTEQAATSSRIVALTRMGTGFRIIIFPIWYLVEMMI